VHLSPFTWSTLRSFRESTAVKASAITLSIVPFIMRVGMDLTPYFGGKRFNIPFNLEMVFFAAIAFAVAVVVYALRCPPLIKKAPNYGAISNGPHSEVDLRRWFHELVTNKAGDVDVRAIHQYLGIARGHSNTTAQEAAEVLDGRAGHALLDRFWDTPAGPRLAHAYDHVRSRSDLARTTARWFSSVFFLLGATFLAASYVYNGYSAYRYFAFPSPSDAAHGPRVDTAVTLAVDLDSKQHVKQTTMNTKSLWITYASTDNKEGNFDFLAQSLTAAGLDVRFDREMLIPGRRLWEQIGGAINAPDLGGWAFLVTPASIESQACLEELAYALDRTLHTRGGDFPIIGLLYGGVRVDQLPPALRIRLCVDLRASNYVDQIKAAIEQRAPAGATRRLDPFLCRIHERYGGNPDLIAFEFSPRIGEIANWRIAFPTGIKPVSYGSGPAGGGGVSSVRFDFVEGTSLTFEGIRMDFVGCSNPIGPATSAYIVFTQKDCPAALHFGYTDSPSGIANTGILFRFTRN
jgi:hypothetical protein